MAFCCRVHHSARRYIAARLVTASRPRLATERSLATNRAARHSFKVSYPAASFMAATWRELGVRRGICERRQSTQSRVGTDRESQDFGAGRSILDQRPGIMPLSSMIRWMECSIIRSVSSPCIGS
jgi:hypothetical protein